MRKTLAILVVFGALGAAAMAGGFSVSFGYSDCGRSYYRPSHHSSHYRPSYRSHHYYRSYSHCYRPSVVYVPRIRYCR